MMKTPYGPVVYDGDSIFLPMKNVGAKLRTGDWCSYQPGVRRSLFRVVRNTKPYARASGRFAGLAVQPAKRNDILQVQVFGPCHLTGWVFDLVPQ